MAYCVNCGVELEATQRVCPLCHVTAQNPEEPWEEPKVRRWPNRVEVVMRRADRRFIAMVASVLMLVPVLVCLVNDVMLSGGITWSSYVVTSILVFWVMVVLPNFYRRNRPYLWPLTSGLAVLGLLFAIERDTGGQGWFLHVGTPITLVGCAFILFFIYWFSRKRPRRLLLSMAAIVFAAGMYTVIIEIVLNGYNKNSFLPSWSWYTLISCGLMGIGLLVLNLRRSWRENIKKRFYY